jgi:diguanylate cyclase (GGDEF)-like protein
MGISRAAGLENKGFSTVDLAQRVRNEQVQLIYRQAPPALAISVLVALLVAYVLWDVSDRQMLIGWVATLMSLSVVRLGLVLAYRRAADRHDARWERWFVATLVAIALVWGAGSVLLMPVDSLAHQAIVYFFLMGMAGGAVASYSAHAVLTTASIVAVMVPATLWFIFGQDDPLLRAMAAGGLIYLAAAYRATRTLAFFLGRSLELSHQLAIAHEREQSLARTDELTGLANRRAFYEAGERALEWARRYDHPLSLVMLDIDHFKRINDMRGHAAGDAALRGLAETLRSGVRAADVVGRLGGEEFALLLPQTPLGDAAAHAERLRAAIGQTIVVHQREEVRFTCSFGVAQMQGSDDLDALIARADAALYRAKEEGRDRVCH